ncbi:hypothetical protein ACFL5G_03150 [Candidatus Margulisiibacteriota bacterium]
MVYHSPRYFCPNRSCPQHNRLLFEPGVCTVCRTTLERIRYCPDCEKMGSPAQNRLCYKCKRYLVDLFEVPMPKNYGEPEIE